MIPIEELTPKDKAFLSTLKSQGVPAEDAFARLEAVRPKAVPTPKDSLASTSGVLSARIARANAGTAEALGRVAGNIGGAVKDEAAAGVESIKKGWREAANPKGDSFVENVEAGLKGALDMGAGVVRTAISPATGLIGGITKPAVEDFSKTEIGKSTFQKLAEVGVEYDKLPEGVKSVLNAGMQALNFVGAGEAAKVAEPMIAKTGAEAGKVGSALKVAGEGMLNDMKAIPSKVAKAFENAPKLPELNILKSAEGILDGSKLVTPEARNTAKQFFKNMIKEETGFNDHTIDFAVNDSDTWGKIVSGEISKSTVVDDVTRTLAEAEDALQETGNMYSAIREDPTLFEIPMRKVDSVLDKNGLKLDFRGKITEKAPNSTYITPDEMKEIQKAYTAVGRAPVANGGEYLMLRRTLDKMKNWESKATDDAKKVIGEIRMAIDADAKNTFGGLELADGVYADQIAELNKFRGEYFTKAPNGGYVLKDGSLSKIMNLTKANRTQQLARLENMVPGIGKKIEGLAALEDYNLLASGHKVATYRKGITGRIAGAIAGSVFGTAGAGLGAVLGASLVSPQKAIELIQKYAGGLWSREAISEVVGKLGSGSKLTKTETGMLENVAKEIAKAPESVKMIEGIQPFRNLMGQGKPEALLRAESDILEEMAASVKGERIFTPSEIGGGSEVTGIKSTYPKWAPDDLRSRELFDRVSSKLVEGKPLNGQKELRLVEAMQSEAKKRLGIEAPQTQLTLPDFLKEEPQALVKPIPQEKAQAVAKSFVEEHQPHVGAKTEAEVRANVDKVLEQVEEKTKIVTDPHDVQEIRNSIKQGQNLLKSGKDELGEPLTLGRRKSIRRAVLNSQAKIGEGPKTKNGYIIEDVTPDWANPDKFEK